MSKATEKTGVGRSRATRTTSGLASRTMKSARKSTLVEVRAIKDGPPLIPGSEVEVVAKEVGGRYILRIKGAKSGRFERVNVTGTSSGMRRAASALGRRAMVKAAEVERQQERDEIIDRITEWAGGADAAGTWYRSFPIPAFGGRTAESLVDTGNAPAVRRYLDAVAVGSFS